MARIPTLTINGGWWQFSAPLRDRSPFRTHGSMHGTTDPIGHGRLPREFWSSFDAATHGNATGYAVYSYATPIAWWSPEDGWTMPEVRYSVTTSKHQGRIRVALAEIERERVESDVLVSDVLALLDENTLWHAGRAS